MAVIPYGWEGDLRSGISLAMHASHSYVVHPLMGSRPKEGRWAHCLHSSKSMPLFLQAAADTVLTHICLSAWVRRLKKLWWIIV